jgi:hypothetical protein
MLSYTLYRFDNLGNAGPPLLLVPIGKEKIAHGKIEVRTRAHHLHCVTALVGSRDRPEASILPGSAASGLPLRLVRLPSPIQRLV